MVTVTQPGPSIGYTSVTSIKNAATLFDDSTPNVGVTSSNGIAVTGADISNDTLYSIGKGSVNDDDRLIRTYLLEMEEGNLLHFFNVPLNVVTLNGATKMRAFIYRSASPEALDLSENTIKRAYEASSEWPDLGTGLRQIYFEVELGINQIDISPLIADLFDKTAWASGDRIHVAFALDASELNNSNYIEINPKTTNSRFEWSSYKDRTHQYLSLGKTIPLYYMPFDAIDSGITDTLRTVTERKDAIKTVVRHDHNVEVYPQLQLTSVEYTGSHTGRIVPVVETANANGQYIVEEYPPGYDDISKLITESTQAGIGSTPDTFVFDPEICSTIMMGSFRFDTSAISATVGADNPARTIDYCGFRWDFSGNIGLMNWAALAYEKNNPSNTLFRVVVKVGSDAEQGPGAETVVEVPVTSLPNNNDLIEIVYFYDHVADIARGRLKITDSSTGEISLYDTGEITDTLRVPYDSDNDFAFAYKIGGYSISDMPSHGHSYMASTSNILTWDEIQYASEWAAAQWQSGFKVLPYSLWDKDKPTYATPNFLTAPHFTTTGI